MLMSSELSKTTPGLAISRSRKPQIVVTRGQDKAKRALEVQLSELERKFADANENAARGGLLDPEREF